VRPARAARHAVARGEAVERFEERDQARAIVFAVRRGDVEPESSAREGAPGERGHALAQALIEHAVGEWREVPAGELRLLRRDAERQESLQRVALRGREVRDADFADLAGLAQPRHALAVSSGCASQSGRWIW
jgi:hypothetical protein